MTEIRTEAELAAVALALIGEKAQLSRAERALVRKLDPCRDTRRLATLRKAIRAGRDPLGEAFTQLRTPEQRRPMGATYTPPPIISSMVRWAASQLIPDRIVDPGSGSGRFLLAAAKQFPNAALVGIEADPLAALLVRANLASVGAAARAQVLVGDYRSVDLAPIDGRTLFLGNPPYVRHHAISSAWKDWFADRAKVRGIKASKLAGLHLHFFLRTLDLATPGDMGAFITSAEWLDVNYGSVLRKLLADGLGGRALHILDPKVMPFEDAATTGAITCFAVGGRRETMTVRAVPKLSALNGLSTGTPVSWQKLESMPRWSAIVRPAAAVPDGYVELGEYCRVHRGQVTGGNDVWIAGNEWTNKLPDRVLVPTITKAREIIAAGDAIASPATLRRVIDLPNDLDELTPQEKHSVSRFLAWAKSCGADDSYIARHRRAWWSVGLKQPAPIVCTYMARRAPAFVRNLCGARHINIAHGLYPTIPLSDAALDALAQWLRTHVATASGRTYAGGLTKFEPRELERIWVPRPEHLAV